MQFVKYKWETERLSGEPFLFSRDEGRVSKIKLLDEEIKFVLSEKTCIGYTKKGKHFECPKNLKVITERHCNECVINDDFFLCVKCDGSECINDTQRNSCEKSNYFVYLAAFGNLLKVGISQEHRVLERLIEQGADMGAKICSIRDGKTVRIVEQKIKKELKLIDRLSGVDKQKMIFGDLNIAALNISNACAKLRSNGFSKYLISPEIYNLQNVYRLESVKSLPKPVTLGEKFVLEGHVIAAKGNIVIAKNSEGIFSFDANKLVGFRYSC